MSSPVIELPLAPRTDLVTALRPWLTRLRRVGLAVAEPERKLVVRAAWQELCDLGAAGVLIPPAHGGQGLGLLDVVELARETTQLQCAVPLLPSAVLATRLAMAAGAGWLLSELATGDRIATVAHGGTLAGGHLTGTLADVLHGTDADVWLVVTDAGIAILDRPGSTLVPTQDRTRPVANAVLDEVAVEVLALPNRAVLRRIGDEAELVRCAEVLAAAERTAADPLLLKSAWGLVQHAAASADADGELDARVVADLVSWTQRVSRSVPTRDTWTHMRAQQASGWRPAL